MNGILSWLEIWKNPLFTRCRRARLRWKPVLTRGLVTLTLSFFLFAIPYLGATERHILDRSLTARATFLPIFVVQGILLMFLGTGAVASGIAMDRDRRMTEFHLLTPLGPYRTVLGYLMGLPIREYLLFLLTLPFTLFSIGVGHIPLGKILHLYSVFFITVILYHLTGLVSGLLARKPRRANWVAQAWVVVLYLILPQFSHLGLTFFEFLTIKPTLYGMIMNELVDVEQGNARMELLKRIEHWSHVPFFNLNLHPTICTLTVQGFLILFLTLISLRKWQDIQRHALNKIQALALFTGILFFLVGSLWPFLTRHHVYSALLQEIEQGLLGKYKFMLVLYVFFMVITLSSLILIHVVTPEKTLFRKGYYRAQNEGRKTIPWNQDAASSRPVLFGFLILSFLGYLPLIYLARHSTYMFQVPPPYRAFLMPMIFFTAILTMSHAVRERYGSRTLFLLLFTSWVVPFFTFVLVVAAWSKVVLASYIAWPSPLISFYFHARYLYQQELPLIETDKIGQLRPHIPTLVLLSASLYMVSAIIFQFILHRFHHSLEKQASH